MPIGDLRDVEVWPQPQPIIPSLDTIVEKAVALKLDKGSILVLVVSNKRLNEKGIDDIHGYINNLEQKFEHDLGFKVPVIFIPEDIKMVVAEAEAQD